MSIENPAFHIKAVPCLAGAITASANGKSIDALGAAAVAFVYQFGTTTSGTSGTVTLSLEESSDDSSFSAISGATTTALTTDSGGQSAKRACVSVSMIGRKRYIRGVLTVAGTVSTAATGPQNAAGVLMAGNLSQSIKSTDFDTFIAPTV